MFVLAESFGIKPWDTDPDKEVYQDDLVNLIAMKDLRDRVQNDLQNHTAGSSVGGPVGQGRVMHVR